jgi:hypothetical protein
MTQGLYSRPVSPLCDVDNYGNIRHASGNMKFTTESEEHTFNNKVNFTCVFFVHNFQ